MRYWTISISCRCGHCDGLIGSKSVPIKGSPANPILTHNTLQKCFCFFWYPANTVSYLPFYRLDSNIIALLGPNCDDLTFPSPSINIFSPEFCMVCYMQGWILFALQSAKVWQHQKFVRNLSLKLTWNMSFIKTHLILSTLGPAWIAKLCNMQDLFSDRPQTNVVRVYWTWN